MQDSTYTRHPEIVKFIESRMLVARGWGRRNGKLLFNGYGGSVWEDEKFWRWMVVTVAQQC